MMHTAQSVKNQLLADLASANTATGKADTTLHDAVTSLIEGFGGGGAEVETGTFTVPSMAGSCNIETSLANISAAIIWADVPSGKYFYTWNTHTIYAVVLGSLPFGESARFIRHTTNNAASQNASYVGGISGNTIAFSRVSNAHGAFQPTQIMDEAGTTEPITYKWAAFGGVTVDL